MLIRDRHIDPAAEGLVTRRMTLAFNPAISLTNGVVALIRARDHAMKLTGVSAFCRTKAGAVAFNAAISPATGVLFPAILAIDAVPEKFKLITNTVVFLVSSVVKTKAPATAIVFTAAHVVTALKFGVVLVQIDAAGTVSTKVPAATQAYATAAAALAALPSADASKVALGYIAIANNAGDWTANTDDLTDASDVTTATFNAIAARTPFSAAVTPLAAEEVTGAIDTSAQSEYQAELDELIAIMATTDGTGALVDGKIDLSFRAGRIYRGE